MQHLEVSRALGSEEMYRCGERRVWKTSPSMEVTPLISPLLRPCHKVEVSQDNDPSWSSSTKTVNGISNYHFSALDTGNLHKLSCSCGLNDEASATV